jgi:hypothetical protein
MKSKATKALVEARVTDLLRIKLDGAEAWDICEYVREKEVEVGSCWHVPDGAKPLSDSQIRRYATKADKLISASSRAHRKKLLRRHLAQRRSLYALAVRQADVRAALACIRDEAELQGLYEIDLVRKLEGLKREIEKLKRDAPEDKTPPIDWSKVPLNLRLALVNCYDAYAFGSVAGNDPTTGGGGHAEVPI